MSWIDLGDTTKGVLIGGGITLTTSVAVEWFRTRAMLKQQKTLFALEAEEAREVTEMRHGREDEVAERETQQTKEEATSQQRIWAKQKIWDRRVQAYDDTIKRLKQMQRGFQEEMNNALNPPHRVDDENPYVPSNGFAKVEEVGPLLDLDVLFLNDRAIKALQTFNTEMQESVLKARTGSRSVQTQNQMIGATGVAATRNAIETIRQEGLEHLGDKERSLPNIAEDAFNLTSGN